MKDCGFRGWGSHIHITFTNLSSGCRCQMHGLHKVVDWNYGVAKVSAGAMFRVPHGSILIYWAADGPPVDEGAKKNDPCPNVSWMIVQPLLSNALAGSFPPASRSFMETSFDVQSKRMSTAPWNTLFPLAIKAIKGSPTKGDESS